MKPTPVDLKRDKMRENGFGLKSLNESEKVDSKTNTSTDCIDCSGNGKLWILPESYQIIKYINFCSGKTHFVNGGKLFIKIPLLFKHIEIIDIRDQLVNLPPRKYLSKDSVTVETDLYFQYSITDVKKFIANKLGLNEKIAENIKSIIQQYFRSKNSSEIAQANISIDEIGRAKFQMIEQQYGIHFNQFGTTSLKLPEIDDDKRQRTETELRMENKKRELNLIKEQIVYEKDIAQARSEIDNIKRTEHITNIMNNIDNFSPAEQARLLKQIYEIDKLSENANVTYISGAENFNNNRRK